MKMSSRLVGRVAVLRRFYAPEVITECLKLAEAETVKRGGRQITPDDWDTAMDADDAPDVVASGYVVAMGKLAHVAVTDQRRGFYADGEPI